MNGMKKKRYVALPLYVDIENSLRYILIVILYNFGYMNVWHEGDYGTVFAAYICRRIKKQRSQKKGRMAGC